MAPGPAPSGSGFWVNRSITTRASLGKRARAPALRPSRHRRAQKTFSAGPCSFRELWFPESIAACRVQPVFDSRHGRIACKVSFSCTAKIGGRAAASNQSGGLLVQPFYWLAAALEIQLFFFVWVANSGNMRFSS
jgi:hypothetical protein